MDADEIIKALKNYVFLYENDKFCDIPRLATAAANYIASAYSKILELDLENVRFKSQQKELMDLLETAIDDLEEAHDCEYCGNFEGCVLNQRECESWCWEYQYRYEALKTLNDKNVKE